MNIDSLLLEAPLLATVVIIVSLFIRYLGKRDEELRHVITQFTDRMGSLEKTEHEATRQNAILQETVHNLDLTMREIRETIRGKLNSQK